MGGDGDFQGYGYGGCDGGGWDMMSMQQNMYGGGWGCGACDGWGQGKGKGKDKSSSSSGKGKPWIDGPEQLYYGQVRSWNMEKKHGFIVCEEIMNNYGQEVYAYKDVLEKGFAGPGDNVVFYLHWSSKGQAQASTPLVRIGTENGYALAGTYKGGRPGEFGFIECEVTKEIFGRDVYVNRDLASNFAPGQHVAFNAYLNRDMMPNASSAEAADESWEPTPPDYSTSYSSEIVEAKSQRKGKDKASAWGMKGDPFSMMKGMMMKGGWGGDGPSYCSKGKGWNGTSKGPYSGEKGGESARGPNPTGEIYLGVVKSINTNQNYGFIACEETHTAYQQDVWVLGTYLVGMSLGDSVSFELAISQRGQPQGINLKLVGGESRGGGACGGISDMVQEGSPMASPSGGMEASNPVMSPADVIRNAHTLSPEEYTSYMSALEDRASQGDNEAAQQAAQLQANYMARFLASSRSIGQGDAPPAKRAKMDTMASMGL